MYFGFNISFMKIVAFLGMRKFDTYLDELEILLWYYEMLVLLYEAYATTAGQNCALNKLQLLTVIIIMFVLRSLLTCNHRRRYSWVPTLQT